MKELDMELPKKLQAWNLLVGLADIYPVRTRMWSREVQQGKLALDDLKKELMGIHFMEVAEGDGKATLANFHANQQNKQQRGGSSSSGSGMKAMTHSEKQG